ncbi:hypothetical protein [Hoeflea sp. TYP-13]|uniref:hypothetical protein n=1 Tax=Hoeflea sp. TYP-13 TaxID=3230023 RepID=UPI0034C5B3ED
MLFKLKIYGAVLGGALLVGGGGMLMQANDLKKNYTLVDARISSVTFDCFIRKGKRKIVEKDTNKLAYMDCKIAPIVAAKYDYEDSAIKKRASVTYRYVSPADGRRYTGSYTRTGDVDHYEDGNMIRIHAHNTEPEKSRTTNGNLFIDDTGA